MNELTVWLKPPHGVCATWGHIITNTFLLFHAGCADSDIFEDHGRSVLEEYREAVVAAVDQDPRLLRLKSSLWRSWRSRLWQVWS